MQVCWRTPPRHVGSCLQWACVQEQHSLQVVNVIVKHHLATMVTVSHLVATVAPTGCCYLSFLIRSFEKIFGGNDNSIILPRNIVSHHYTYLLNSNNFKKLFLQTVKVYQWNKTVFHKFCGLNKAVAREIFNKNLPVIWQMWTDNISDCERKWWAPRWIPNTVLGYFIFWPIRKKAWCNSGEFLSNVYKWSKVHCGIICEELGHSVYFFHQN